MHNGNLMTQMTNGEAPVESRGVVYLHFIALASIALQALYISD